MYNSLQHHGILGMKWGVRRFQNKDGSLTSAGKKRIEKLQTKAKDARKNSQEWDKASKESSNKRFLGNKSAAEIAGDIAMSERKRADKILDKIGKIEMKSLIKQEATRIQKGASTVEKIWNTITNSHKIEAEVLVRNRKYD